jgi:tryptophan aminotransferase
MSRRDSLRIIKEHDLLLLEDEPYVFLYYGDSPVPRSYLGLEREVNGETGRVIRFDSFSKVMSSGTFSAIHRYE